VSPHAYDAAFTCLRSAYLPRSRSKTTVETCQVPKGF